jgi:predicted AAA+ superfamily ATPase
VEYLENSWLVFAVSQYDFSVKRQQIAPKKVYSIDPGLARTAGFSFSPDTGRWLENVVFLELRRQTAHLHYLATPAGFEVDFYLPDRGQLVQVAQHLEHPATREREIRALADALKKVPARRALILADANEDGFKLGAMPVEVRSVAEWLAGASADR